MVKIHNPETDTTVDTPEAETACLMVIRGPWVFSENTAIQTLIDEELGRIQRPLTSRETELFNRRKSPDNWSRLRDRMKRIIVELWQYEGAKKGYLTQQQIIEACKDTDDLFKYRDDTLSARTRELASPKIEDPPFLQPFLAGERTGRYVLYGKNVLENISRLQ